MTRIAQVKQPPAPVSFGGRLAKRLTWPVRAYGPEITSIVVGVLLWEIIGRSLDFTFFPPISAIALAWWKLYQAREIVQNLSISLVTLVIGFGLAALLGLITGGLMGRYRKIEWFLDPFFDINLSTPPLVYVPVLFLFFGLSSVTRVVIVFIFAYFVIAINVMTGIRGCDSSLLEMAHSFGARERQLFWKVRLPAALPMIMAGMRIGVIRGVKGMIMAEMFIALVGLGALIRLYGGAFAVEEVLALVLTIVAVAVVVSWVVQFVDRRLTGKWL